MEGLRHKCTSWGGQGGVAAPPQLQKCLKCFEQNADDWDKSTQEMCSGKAMCIVKIHEIEITSINN